MNNTVFSNKRNQHRYLILMCGKRQRAIKKLSKWPVWFAKKWPVASDAIVISCWWRGTWDNMRISCQRCLPVMKSRSLWTWIDQWVPTRLWPFWTSCSVWHQPTRFQMWWGCWRRSYYCLKMSHWLIIARRWRKRKTMRWLRICQGGVGRMTRHGSLTAM